MNPCSEQAEGVSLTGVSFSGLYWGGRSSGGLCVCGYVNARLGAQPTH